MPRRIDGQVFWMHPRLLTTETRHYQPHIFPWIVDHLPPGGVLYDVGAHYGGLALGAAGTWVSRPRGRVRALPRATGNAAVSSAPEPDASDDRRGERRHGNGR